MPEIDSQLPNFTLLHPSPSNPDLCLWLQESVILQFYLIPVAQVISDFRPGYQYQPTYACDACALFATGITGDNCCPALDTCAFRAADCKDEEAVPPLPTLSPPPLVAPSPPGFVPASHFDASNRSSRQENEDRWEMHVLGSLA